MSTKEYVEETVPYADPVSQFKEQWARMLTVWRNNSNIKTQAQLIKHLGLTDTEFIKASRDLGVPQEWLIKTANELRMDVTFIVTGKAADSPTVIANNPTQLNPE